MLVERVRDDVHERSRRHPVPSLVWVLREAATCVEIKILELDDAKREHARFAADREGRQLLRCDRERRRG